MDLFAQIDAYCERLGPGYWAEPVNAVTNLAFMLVAVWMWRRSARVGLARLLAGILFAIGVGSYLFHTHAQGWAALADVLPILAYILVYIFAINRDVWGMRTPWALGAGRHGVVRALCGVVGACVQQGAGAGQLGGLCAGAFADCDLCGGLVAA